jgi:formate-dependent nitrite reductase membrane component NrfD
MKPRTSWIARGTWIISTFMLVAFVHAVLLFFTDLGARPEGPAIFKAIAVVGIVLAVSTMAYTGILLGASKGITFWRTGAVPVVFVVSALVTGHFAILIGLVLFGEGAATMDALRLMGAEAAVLVVFEVLAILFLLQAAWKSPDPRESVERLLRSRMFLVGYVLLGLVAPLVLMLLLYRGMGGATDGVILFVAAVGSVLGLAGGLILRQAVLVFGALPTLNISGFEFRRVARPREPKPAIGLVPPQ